MGVVLTRALVSLFVVLAFAPDVDGAVRRFALIIGNNTGDAADERLRFAEDDARRMRDILGEFGGVRRADSALLLGEDADTVRRQLREMNVRIRRLSYPSATDTFLFVFYSGHADAEALHMAGSRLDLEELRQLIDGSPARLRVLVLDACNSGAVTGVKGSRPAPAFPLELDERLEGEGVAIITSSRAGELSQESEKLGGSFFSHYFMVGLLGPADVDDDGRVTLREAYAYAHWRTLRETSRTPVGAQHSTYEYEMRGGAHVTITDLNAQSQERATLVFAEPGDYYVFQGAAEGPLLAEVVTDRARRNLAVPAGTYQIVLRQPEEVRERTVRALAGSSVLVRQGEMSVVPYEQLHPKGGFTRGRLHGPVAAVLYRGETLNSLGGMLLGGVGYPVLFGHVWLRPRLLVGGSTFRSGDFSLKQVELDAELLVSYGVDFRYFVLLLGGGVGGIFLRQDASHSTGLADRSTSGVTVSVHTELVVPIHAGFYLQLGVEGLAVLLDRQLESGGAAWRPSPSWRVGLGLGYAL